MSIDHILVVCTGNICRSPIAEALLKQKLSSLNIEIRSAGTHASTGQPAEKGSFHSMGRYGHLLNEHRAQQVNTSLIAWSDLILAMDNSHIDWLRSFSPYSRGKIFKLTQWTSNNDIQDPYRQPLQVFNDVYEKIDFEVDCWVEKIKVLKK